MSLRWLPVTLLAPIQAVAAELPPTVLEAVSRERPVAGAEVVVEEYRETLPPDCTASSAILAARPDAAGRATVRLNGQRANGAPCQGVASVRVHYKAEVWVTREAVARGALLANSVERQRRAVPASSRPLTDLGPDAKATMFLSPGTVLEDRHMNEPRRAGESVTVVVTAGSVTLRQPGRLIPCTMGKACATLPSGKRVEGRLVNAELFVEAL